jgi:hypothetical protein
MAAPLQRLMERTLEHNQQAASCCRNSDNLEIEAWACKRGYRPNE